MFFYSNVPLVDAKNCPLAAHHNNLARQFNLRLSEAGPASAWSIFYYANGIFMNMRNSATPSMPLGINPAEDEWWNVYALIDLPTAQTGEGNWPIAFAGTPQGANVMNPLNAYMFGRVTAENKVEKRMGPWAEGNLFDGLVQSSRAVLSNSSYWGDSFRQRGSFRGNLNYDRSAFRQHRSGTYVADGERRHFGIKKYLPSDSDPAYFSKGLFWVGRSSDHYFPEYASNHVYMRYPPNVTYGVYTKYGQSTIPSDGVLKRKNATKDLLRWVLWVYTYYFRGSEQQRSLFCEAKSWDAPVVEFSATKEYLGQQTFGMNKVRTKGALNVCKVGFDFFSYMTRQNVLAPALSEEINLHSTTSPASYKKIDDMGYIKLNPYRPTFTWSIGHGNEDLNFLDNKVIYPISRRHLFEGQTCGIENYDDHAEVGFIAGGRGMYGKCLRFEGDYDRNGPFANMLFRNGGSTILPLKSLQSEKARRMANHCLAGYYIETTAVDNPDMAFKIKIWGNNSILLHESIIWKRYSYAVNRSFENKAYIYNKIFYFKNPIVNYDTISFELCPVLDDKGTELFGGGTDNDELTKAAKESKENYFKRRAKKKELYPDDQSKHFDKVISFGNPWVSNKPTSISNSSDAMSIGTGSSEIEIFQDGIRIPNSQDTKLGGLENGDAIAVQIAFGAALGAEFAMSRGFNFVNGGRPYYVFIDGTENGKKVVKLSKRRDSGVTKGNGSYAFLEEEPIADTKAVVKEWVEENSDGVKRKVVIRKLTLENENMFKVKIEPAILLKQRPSFQDAYALLRAATSKGAGANSLLAQAGIDQSGVGTVGHDFFDSNRVWRNYLKYGSGTNVYGSDRVPALRQKVSFNPLYESARKFVSSYMRMATRHDLMDYRVEGGTGVLYFKRYNKYLPQKARATIFKHMEPSVEPAGRFHEGSKALDNLSNANYKPIVPNKQYYVFDPRGVGIRYAGVLLYHGFTVLGVAGKPFIDNGSEIDDDTTGLYELEGITQFDASKFPVDIAKNYSESIDKVTRPGETAYASYPHTSNEWIMFLNGVHYNRSISSIYKPGVYGDIMGFLNNRCHHRSREYERSYGVKYDMIRQELLRVPTAPYNTPSPRLQVFLSKSPANFNYIFNTNSPYDGGVTINSGSTLHKTSYLDKYGVKNYISEYHKSCPAVSPKPYKVTSCTVVDSFGGGVRSGIYSNPSSKKISGVSKAKGHPFGIVRVVLDRRLENAGNDIVNSGGWAQVDIETLKTVEERRTDENTVVEYLLHKHLGRSGYNCKRTMLGDYSTTTDPSFDDGSYRPWGACFPRFYFLKLIPYVGVDSPLETDPYAQMDFYTRAMAGQFVAPSFYNAPGQVGSVNWNFSELASRSSEEDPAAYYYVDPREISNG